MKANYDAHLAFVKGTLPQMMPTPQPQNYAYSTATGWQRGRCRWFSRTKGYGFVTPDDGSPDLFVHRSAISGSWTPRPGQQVRFCSTFDAPSHRITCLRGTRRRRRRSQRLCYGCSSPDHIVRDCPDRHRTAPASPLQPPHTAGTGPVCPVLESSSPAVASETPHPSSEPGHDSATATERDESPLPTCGDDAQIDVNAATHPAPPPVARQVKRLPYAPVKSHEVMSRARETMTELISEAMEKRKRQPASIIGSIIR